MITDCIKKVSKFTIAKMNFGTSLVLHGLTKTEKEKMCNSSSFKTVTFWKFKIRKMTATEVPVLRFYYVIN